MDQFLFADEAGCLTFKRAQNVSRFFILVTVHSVDCTMGTDLLDLRRQLAWEGAASGEGFHATEDSQIVRDRVYALLGRHNFRIDATILEKSKAQAQLRSDEATFYKYAWYYHLKYTAPRVVQRDRRLLISAASIGTKKRRSAFLAALEDVARQAIPHTEYRVAFWPAQGDPCLQVADYCAWAIQRKWERDDRRSYDLISNKVRTDYNLFGPGAVHYY